MIVVSTRMRKHDFQIAAYTKSYLHAVLPDKVAALNIDKAQAVIHQDMRHVRVNRAGQGNTLLQ